MSAVATRMLGRLALLASLGWLGGMPTAAQAEQGVVEMDEKEMDDERARSHFQVGQSMYQAGRFGEAGQEWEKAFQLSGRVLLLYNVYVAYRDAADSENAIRALELYLEKAELEQAERMNLEARLQAMRKAQAEEASPAVAAVASEMEPQPAPEQATSRVSTDSGGGAGPWIVVGVGGAMVIGGVVTGILANDKRAQIEADCVLPDSSGEPRRCSNGFDLDGTRDSAKNLALATDILLIGGGAAVVGGLIWHFLSAGQESPVQASIGCGPGGCAGHVAGAF